MFIGCCMLGVYVLNGVVFGYGVIGVLVEEEVDIFIGFDVFVLFFLIFFGFCRVIWVVFGIQQVKYVFEFFVNFEGVYLDFVVGIFI